MATPTLSVLMPVFNAETTVEAAITSVLNSSFTDFELVVLDDGSTDATREVVRSLADPRIRLLQGPHEGLVSALNQGVAHCRARLVARMDADDLCDPRRFERQIDVLQDPRIGIVGGQVRIVDPDLRPVPSWRRYESWINDHLDPHSIRALRFVESPLVHPTVTARSEVLSLGYREGHFPEDYDLWLRALAVGFEAVKVPEIVLDWIDSDDRLTRNDSRYSSSAFDQCRRMHLLHGPLSNVAEINLWGAGHTGKGWLHWLQSQRIKVHHIIDVDPGKIGQRIHGVPVVAPDDLGGANGIPLLAAVGTEGARELIADYVRERNYEIGRDVWFVA